MKALLALAAFALAPMVDAGVCPLDVSGMTLETGEVVTVEDRSGEVVTIRFNSARNSFVFRNHAGLVPVDTQGVDGPIVYNWTTPLPALADLAPGATFWMEGSLEEEGQPVALAEDFKVIGPEVLMVGNCPLEVMKIESFRWYAGEKVGLTTLYLHVPSLLVLRTEMQPEGDELIISMAASLQ